MLIAVTCSVTANAAEPLTQRNEQVIEPKLERRQIITPKIDTEDFEVGAFFGFMSVEDFGVNAVYGANLTYHITEDLFVEGRVGFTKTEKTSYERLSGTVQVLTDDQRDLTYYNISLGYNLLPGEGFWSEKTAFTSSLFLTAGIGSTRFADDDRFTFSVGGGYKILPTDWYTIRIDVRDHIFNVDLLGESKDTHNIETTLGVTFFF
ncbi:MAG: outer membrane beta-barrel domain-containing protein [Thioalkalispiraceae bacterium]